MADLKRTNTQILNIINNNGRKTRLLVDFSAHYYRSYYSVENELLRMPVLNNGIVKYSVISKLNSNIRRFPKESEVTLCLDIKQDKKYWRHDIFPNYKVNRKYKEGRIPKEFINGTFGEIEKDLKTYFPYKVIGYPGLEADDIITILTKEYAADNIIIISSDKDFKQLTNQKNIFLFDPIKKVFLEEYDIEKFKFTHIMKGDAVDNIPNILSDVDVFQTDTRQKPLRKTKINDLFYEYIKENSSINKYLSEEQLKRFNQNKELILLDNIPEHYNEKVLSIFNDYSLVGKNKNSMFQWCIKNKQRVLMEELI